MILINVKDAATFKSQIPDCITAVMLNRVSINCLHMHNKKQFNITIGKSIFLAKKYEKINL